ncbi:OLC1v1039211C1 [Oldenlandia corymbosa var. corymbosa]|uniref:OLC1v1039211C1 n=1 Tax=Oldenlandia corymbosa var. corymbosa TaxID=529605 RepID=A0AAV1D1Z5_OLDCO|nr:OLC1v1039211C1 [Oldenlandia corymbosa var. corymbosa]
MVITPSYRSMLYIMMFMIGILVFIPHLCGVLLTDPYTKYSQLNLPPGVKGDSVSLDPLNQGPYVGVSDGRILKYNGTDFVDFAYLSPNRSKQLCDGTTDISLSTTCGRPLGFSFDPLTGYLYIVGAYGGFYRVSPQGGLATKFATDVNGVPFHFLNGIDFDPIKRVVYFTDTSLVFSFTDVLLGNPLNPEDSTGRLIEYNTITGKLRVLIDQLPLPTGPAASGDGTFILYGSTTGKIFKYTLPLIGSLAGKPQALLNLTGYPLKIKRAAELGCFWVPVNELVQLRPRLVHPFGYKFNSTGGVILIKNFTAEYFQSQVNVVQEYGSFLGLGGKTLYVGSIMDSYVGVYGTQ